MFDWTLFSASHEQQKQYTVEVRNRFDVLEVEKDANEKYQRFVEANRPAMEAWEMVEHVGRIFIAAQCEEDNQQLKEYKIHERPL